MRKIIFHLNTLEQGGIERVVTNLANHLAGNGHDVIVATEWYGEAEFCLLPLVSRFHVGLREADEKKSRALKAFLRVKYLRDLIKKENPDIVIAFGRNTNYRAVMAAAGLITPVIISIRNATAVEFASVTQKILAAILYKRAAGCVFQTSEQRNFFSKRIQKKSRIILNPLNPKYINQNPPLKRTKEIVHSSRLEQRKNQAGIINAFINIHHDYPDYVLKLYGGDSPDGTRTALEKLIAVNNAESYVKLMGRSDSLEKELNTASIYIFNSDWEGLPNALMEAMALGLPVISTACSGGGPKTLIEDGFNGLLIPVGDENALENAIRRLLENPDFAETLGQAASKINEKCHLDAIAKEWCNYIEEICESKGVV
ncbi:MAG: glycosyltransferase [Lachnospiraceae bacterium]|nr:glycosyltransferase [Lachnospiraceae bacterium]